MRFQKKKVNEAISNPKGQKSKESPLITKLQKFVVNKQLNNSKLNEQDADSFATSNPRISSLNIRISRLKELVAKKPDSTKEKQLSALVAQQQRMEADEAKKRLRKISQSGPNKVTPQNQNISGENPK